MKVNTQSKNKHNPTTETQERVISFLKEKENLVSVNYIASHTGMNWYAVKGAVEFLSKYGLISCRYSNSNQLLVQLKQYAEVTNATTN